MIRYENADCMDVLSSLPSASVPLIVTDPPYATTNLPFDEAARKSPFDWQAWWKEVRRVQPETGIVVMFAAQRFTVQMILANERDYRYRMVWAKTLATGFLNAAHRPLEAHEDMLLFCRKLKSSTYNPQKRVLEGGALRVGKRVNRAPGGVKHYGGQKGGSSWADDGTRHPTTIWAYSNGGGGESWHPSEKPLELIRDLILTFSCVGDLVFDPFAGSGTTALACLQTGRDCIATELDPHWHARGSERLASHLMQPPLLVGT